MDKLKEMFGNQKAIAKMFKVSEAAVSYWFRDGLPAKRAIYIEKITDGKIKAIELIKGGF
jgi:DNA-binding transcriptional regulator YdaS (Cro superfamily)